MENPTQMTEERETVSTEDTHNPPQSGAEPQSGQSQSGQPQNGQPHESAQAAPRPEEHPQAQQPHQEHQAQQPQAAQEPPSPADDAPEAAPAQPEPQQHEPQQAAPAQPEQIQPEPAHEPQPAPEAAPQAAEQAAPETPAEPAAEPAAETAAAAQGAEENTGEEKPASKTPGSMMAAGKNDGPKDPNNPLGRPLSKDFDFMVSDEEFEDMIRKYCRDLTKRCAEGKEDPVIGRDEEVIKMSTILLQRGRSNVVLLAEGGVGKTALFSALAHYFVSPDVPDIYKGARVIDVDLTSMAAGTESRAQFEGRLKPFLQACTERNEERVLGTPIVICLDEVHTTMGSCKASSAAGVADVMKPALTAGNLYVVGATTVEEYNLYCKPDAAYDRRFQKIHVGEPTVEDTIFILKGLKSKYADYHQLTISDELVEWFVPIVTKFLRKRMNPDKSIMMLDASCAEALKEGAFGGELTREHCARAIGSEAGVKWEALIDGV